MTPMPPVTARKGKRGGTPLTKEETPQKKLHLSHAAEESSAAGEEEDFVIHRRKEENEETDDWVQEELHKQVGYRVEGKTELSNGMAKAFGWVKDNFDIPWNHDKLHKFGSLSGTYAEERLMIAYENGLLLPKHGRENQAGVKICRECGDQGHFPRDCEALLE